MKIIAHRGASGQYPENTLLAFEQAIKHGCDGIELDIQYHESGEFILLHDAHLLDEHQQPTLFTDLSLEQLTTHPAGRGEQIPTLKQALKTINGRCLVNIEIKSAYVESNSINNIIELLNKQVSAFIEDGIFKPTDFVFSSFNHHMLVAVKRLNSQFKTAALLSSIPIDYAAFAEPLAVTCVNPAMDSINKAFVDDAKKRGLEVWVYTVNFSKDIDYCQKLNVDAIFTDFPKQTREYIKNKEI